MTTKTTRFELRPKCQDDTAYIRSFSCSQTCTKLRAIWDIKILLNGQQKQALQKSVSFGQFNVC